MLSAETLKRIRRIELHTRRLVNDTFSGPYHSIFKGRGMAFDSVRPYQPGDDVRDIDWNVTARAKEPFVKQYTEERELTVMLILDSSASCLFGTVGKQKRDIAVELGAVLALSAVSNNDKVGLVIFSDKIEHYIAPRKGRNHVLRLIRDLLSAEPVDRGTDISLALRTVNRLLKQRTIVFLLSDFLAVPQDYFRDLVITSRRHDLIAVIMNDPIEERWPAVGLVGVKDAETGEEMWIDTSSSVWRQQFTRRSERFRQMRDETLLRSGVDCIDLRASGGDYIKALTAFFRQRAQRIRR